MNTKPTSFTNPRRLATIENWPYGGDRVTAKFEVITTNRGDHVGRQTKSPTSGAWNKPKYSTYARKFVIVDGDNGKTYLLGNNGSSISIWSSDMKHIVETVFGDHPQFTTLFDLCEVKK